MVGDQGPGKTAGVGVGQHLAQPCGKIKLINVVPEYFPALDSSYDNMVQRTRRVYACLARHVLYLIWHGIYAYRGSYLFTGVPITYPC